MQKDTYILAIESSCDETAAAVVVNGREVLSNVISSQIDIHTLYGGVVPEIASRKHTERINQVVKKGLSEAGLTLRDGTVCLPARLEKLGPGECLVTVTEGKYHQVRRMLAARGKPVQELRRLSIGALCLDENSEPGSLRELGEDDLCKMFRTGNGEN